MINMSNVSIIHQYENLPIDQRVKRVLKHTPLFDGHNDLPQQPRAVTHGLIYNQAKFDFANGFERGMTDIPRLRQGEFPAQRNYEFVAHLIKIGAVGAQFWSICVPCIRSAENFSTPEYSDMARDAIEQIDMTVRLLEQYADVFELVSEPGDVKRVYAEGKIASSIGIEGLIFYPRYYHLHY
jgi:membrane dipeptidase